MVELRDDFSPYLPVSPLYLPYISPISPLYLPYICPKVVELRDDFSKRTAEAEALKVSCRGDAREM